MKVMLNMFCHYPYKNGMWAWKETVTFSIRTTISWNKDGAQQISHTSCTRRRSFEQYIWNSKNRCVRALQSILERSNKLDTQKIITNALERINDECEMCININSTSNRQVVSRHSRAKFQQSRLGGYDTFAPTRSAPGGQWGDALLYCLFPPKSVHEEDFGPCTAHLVAHIPWFTGLPGYRSPQKVCTSKEMRVLVVVNGVELDKVPF